MILSSIVLGYFTPNHIFDKFARPASAASDDGLFDLDLEFFVPTTVLAYPKNN